MQSLQREGKITSSVGIATTEVLVETIGAKFAHNTTYKMIKISGEEYYQHIIILKEVI